MDLKSLYLSLSLYSGDLPREGDRDPAAKWMGGGRVGRHLVLAMAPQVYPGRNSVIYWTTWVIRTQWYSLTC